VSFYFCNGGTYGSPLASAAVSWSALDTLRFEVNGNQLTAKQNGATILGPTTDNSLSSGTRCGVAASGYNIYDNWGAGDLAAPPAGHPAVKRHGLWRYGRPVEVGRSGILVA
jgi:hypothetical protein